MSARGKVVNVIEPGWSKTNRTHLEVMTPTIQIPCLFTNSNSVFSAV